MVPSFDNRGTRGPRLSRKIRKQAYFISISLLWQAF